MLDHSGQRALATTSEKCPGATESNCESDLALMLGRHQQLLRFIVDEVPGGHWQRTSVDTLRGLLLCRSTVLDRLLIRLKHD